MAARRKRCASCNKLVDASSIYDCPQCHHKCCAICVWGFDKTPDKNGRKMGQSCCPDCQQTNVEKWHYCK